MPSINAPRQRGVREKIKYVYFDEATVATGANANNYFTGNASKTVLQTNFPQSGRFPDSKTFDLTRIRIVPTAGTNAADIYKLYNNSLLDLFVGDKNYLNVPLFMVPGGTAIITENITGIAAAAAAPSPANSVSNAHCGVEHLSNAYLFDPEVRINPTETLRVVLTTFAGYTPNASVVVKCLLEGVLFRDPQ